MQKKTAQELKKRHKLRRVFNPTGKALTALNPAFKKVIRELDKVDKKVRKEAEDLNYFIGMARSFIRRKDYLTAATYLVKFHEKANLIQHQLNSFDADISKSNRKFLLQQFKNKEKKQLFDYDPKKDLSKVDDGLVAQAGTLKDWWRTPGRFQDLYHNMTDRKTHSMKALEKNFSIPFFAQLKNETKDMLSQTNDFYRSLLENFQQMGSAWSTRNVGEYMNQIREINGGYKPYHSSFVKYYENNIVPMKEEQARLDKEDEEARAARAPKEPLPESLDIGPPMEPEADPFANTMIDPRSNSIDVEFSKNNPSMIMEPGSVTQKTPNDFATVRPRPQGIKMEPDTFVGPSNRGENSEIRTQVSPGTKRVTQPSNKVPTKQFPYFTTPSVKGPRTNPFPFYTTPPKSAPFSFNAPAGHTPASGLDDLMEYDLVKKKPSVPFSFNAPPGHTPASGLSGLMEYDLTKRKAHEDFLNRIEKLSTDSEIIREILTYSEEVEKYSEEESLKLLSVAEGLIEKNAGIFDRIKKTLSEPEKKNQTEKKTLVKEPSAPIDQQENDILSDIAPNQKLGPVDHGIPEGTVEKRWFDIPFLAAKKVEDIQLSSNTANVILKKIVKHLYHKFVPFDKAENFEVKLVSAVKQSLTRSKIISNMACNDKHNPRDCQLEAFCYVRLENIDPIFKDLVLSFTATCRLSTFDGDIIVRNITNPKLHNVPK